MVRTDKFELQEFVAWFAWLFIHIAFLVGFRNKLSVLLGWAYSYLVNTPQARIIVYPPSGRLSREDSAGLSLCERPTHWSRRTPFL